MFEEAATLTHPAVANAASKSKATPGSGPGDQIQTKFMSEDAIRLRAYQKWEAAGKPAGDGVGFWLEAERELSRSRSRIRKWWTHIQPWIVPSRLKFIRRNRWQHP
jgi:hypothetical protein